MLIVEKRTATLYAYITKTNREFITKMTARVRKQTKAKVSESEVVDRMIQRLRFLDGKARKNARKSN